MQILLGIVLNRMIITGVSMFLILMIYGVMSMRMEPAMRLLVGGMERILLTFQPIHLTQILYPLSQDRHRATEILKPMRTLCMLDRRQICRNQFYMSRGSTT